MFPRPPLLEGPADGEMVGAGPAFAVVEVVLSAGDALRCVRVAVLAGVVVVAVVVVRGTDV